MNTSRQMGAFPQPLPVHLARKQLQIGPRTGMDPPSFHPVVLVMRTVAWQWKGTSDGREDNHRAAATFIK